MGMAEGRPNIKNVNNMFHDPDYTEKTYPDNVSPYTADTNDDSTYSPSLDDDDGLSS